MASLIMCLYWTRCHQSLNHDCVVKKMHLLNKGIIHLISYFFLHFGFKNDSQTAKICITVYIFYFGLSSFIHLLLLKRSRWIKLLWKNFFRFVLTYELQILFCKKSMMQILLLWTKPAWWLVSACWFWLMHKFAGQDSWSFCRIDTVWN